MGGLATTCLVGAGPVVAQASVTGQWSRVQNLPFAPVHDVYLPNGRVLLVGRNRTQTLWDSVTQSIIGVPSPGYDLFCAGHGYLPDGRVLLAGGHIADFVGLAKASVYDPRTNTWTPAPDMNAGRWYPTVTTLPNGDSLVVSGSMDTSQSTNTLPQVYQPATNSWRNLTSAQLSQPMYPMMFVAPNGRVVDVGPSTTTRSLDTSGTGSWSFVANRNHGWRDYGTAVMYAEGKILVAGGGDPPQASAEVIDLNAATPSWRTVPSMSIARRHLNSTLLPDGTVLVTGGTSGPGHNNASTPVFPAELWNPATERWTTLASGSVPRLYHSAALLLPDGRVVVTGGDNVPEVEIFSPPYLFKGARPALSGVPSQVGYGQRVTVQSAQAAGIGKVTLIRLSAVTHAFNMDQRINVLPFAAGAGTLDITLPSSANQAPPGMYMVFLVDGNGVPSVGSVVQLGGTSGSVTPPSTGTTTGCSFPAWVQGRQYAAGAIVSYNGSNYVAKFANPGYNPTISTYYWAPYQCSTTSTPPPPAPAPAVSSLAPATATAGGAAFTLTVNGSNFVSGATVRWNGTARSTTFVGASQLRAAITAADIGAAGTAQVTVLNPGGAASGSALFTVASPPAAPAPTGCSFPAWVQGQQYAAGAIVTYNGSFYIAKFANPGYNPTISTYYWGTYACTSGTSTSPPPTGCTFPAWVQGRQYAAGAIVSYNGSNYIAKFANPGYNPTISTFYWAPHQC
ncbi:hypothetical protein ASG30_19865 [Ramlibacter sp. Leaf400]|nr:hypothetical protein ASG30_19865 [Ramlibacter sp. Leaf400]